MLKTAAWVANSADLNRLCVLHGLVCVCTVCSGPLLNVCLFVLRFYGPVNPMGSCQARSVYLTTRLLGRLSPLRGYLVLCTFFRQKLKTALLDSAGGREWPQKIFHDQSPRRNVADHGGDWTRDFLVSSRIQLSVMLTDEHWVGPVTMDWTRSQAIRG